jgi:hypothetical protein
MMANTKQQHKHANNKTKRAVGKPNSPPKAMAMVDMLLFTLLQSA